VTHFMHSRNCELITRRGSVTGHTQGSQHTHLCAAASMTCLTIAACHARIRPGQPCAAAPQPSTRFRIHAGDGSLARGIDVFAPGSGMCRAAAIRAEVRVPSRPPRLDTAEHRRAGHPLRRLAFALGIWSRSGTFRRKWIWIPVDNGRCSPPACGTAWTAERCGGHGGDSIQGRRGASWMTSRPSWSA
jgi:hypothetical protein